MNKNSRDEKHYNLNKKFILATENSSNKFEEPEERLSKCEKTRNIFHITNDPKWAEWLTNISKNRLYPKTNKWAKQNQRLGNKEQTGSDQKRKGRAVTGEKKGKAIRAIKTVKIS